MSTPVTSSSKLSVTTPRICISWIGCDIDNVSHGSRLSLRFEFEEVEPHPVADDFDADHAVGAGPLAQINVI